MVRTRKQDVADGVAETINAVHGEGRAIGLGVDVGVEADVEALVGTAVTVHGRLDVLVSNAAITPSARGVDREFEDFTVVLRVNLGRQFLASRAAARVMVQRGRGRIIHVTSTRAVVGVPRLAAYSASKAGINNLSNELDQELADLGVRTVAVAPGLTEHTRDATCRGCRAHRPGVGAYPGGRLGRPEVLTASSRSSPARPRTTSPAPSSRCGHDREAPSVRRWQQASPRPHNARRPAGRSHAPHTLARPTRRTP